MGGVVTAGMAVLGMAATVQSFTHDPGFGRNSARDFSLAGESYAVAPGDSLYSDCGGILGLIFGEAAAENTDELACVAPGPLFEMGYYYEQAQSHGFDQPFVGDEALRNLFCRGDDLMAITMVATGGHFPRDPEAVEDYVLTGVALFQYRQGGGCPGL